MANSTDHKEADEYTCTHCEVKSDRPLKRCAKCRSVFYCSRDCQTRDWKGHKKECSKLAGAASTPAVSTKSSTGPETNNPATTDTGSRAKGLHVRVDKPFHKLHARQWLHGRSEEDVYKLLIDTYRLRAEDDYKLEGSVDEDSIYGGAASSVPCFRRFLSLAERRGGLLPAWWSEKKRQECLSVGLDTNGWSSLDCCIEKPDIIEHYGDALMPMQLRMLGEQVYGRGPGGQEGKTMMRMRMMEENGEASMAVFSGVG